MDDLDHPTVFRAGTPALGLPILALEYRVIGRPPFPWWRRLLFWGWTSYRQTAVRVAESAWCLHCLRLPRGLRR